MTDSTTQSSTVEYVAAKRRRPGRLAMLGWQLLVVVALGVMFFGAMLTVLGLEGFADAKPDRLTAATGIATIVAALILFFVALVRLK